MYLFFSVRWEEHDELPGDGEVALQQRGRDTRRTSLLHLEHKYKTLNSDQKHQLSSRG